MARDNDTPKAEPVPKTAGYPNPKPNTQTMKIRGTGAATKGTNFNPKGVNQIPPPTGPINIYGR